MKGKCMNELNFCVAGAGSIGRRHLRLLKERGDIRLSVVEPSEKSWARIVEEMGEFRRFHTLEEALVSGNLDAVVIATPHGMHAEMSIQALDAGVNVFCEKPMSDSVEECMAMQEAVQRSGKVFSVGFMFHFDPFIRKIREILVSGRIGTPVHFYSRLGTYNTLLCSVSRHQAYTPYSIIMDCIHDTDLLCWLTGRVPDYVFMNGIQAGALELTSAPNVIDAVYRYADGTFAAHSHFNYVQHPQVHTLEITGDRGYIQGDFMTARITAATFGGKMEIVTAERQFDDVYRAEWEWFVKAVRGETSPENPAASAILPTLLMHAQMESARNGREADVREIAERYGFL